MSTSERALSPDTATWLEPLLRFGDRVHEIATMVHLFRIGCRDTQMSAELFDILADGGNPMASLDERHELASLAQDQQARGYPLLYEHSLISLWGALEVLIEDLAVAWLATHPEQLQVSPVSDVKLTVGDFEKLSADERLRHVVFEVQRGTKADLKRGVGQFNALLNAVGISWAPSDGVRDALFYHHQLRNVFAHRGGVADRRFTEICPTLGYDVGESVLMTGRVFAHLLNAAGLYVVGLRNHCAETDGIPVNEFDSRIDPSFDWATMRSQPTQPP